MRKAILAIAILCLLPVACGGGPEGITIEYKGNCRATVAGYNDGSLLSYTVDECAEVGLAFCNLNGEAVMYFTDHEMPECDER